MKNKNGVVVLKKIGIFLLLAIFMVTSSYATYQEAPFVTENFDSESITIKVLEKNEQYEKLEVIDKKTGKVEIAESVLGIKGMNYIITDKKSGERTYIISEDNKTEIIRNGVTIWRDDYQEKIIYDSKGILFNGSFNRSLSWSDWTGWSTYSYTCINPISLGATVVAAHLATKLDLPTPLSELFSVAVFICTNNLNTSYAEKRLRQRYDFSIGQAETNAVVKKYRNSNLTEQFGETIDVYYYLPID